MTTKNCRQCGTEFAAYNNAQQYCPRCKKEGIKRRSKKSPFRIPNVCAHCGTQFTSDRKRKYCDYCKDVTNRRNTKPRKKPKNFMSIEEVARESRKLGISAGEYMAKFCYGKEG
jgi:predicted Zn-ribbon and HTH transcriptional regulator